MYTNPGITDSKFVLISVVIITNEFCLSKHKEV